MTLEDKQEPTVEQALKELRELFPEKLTTIYVRAYPGFNEYGIAIGYRRNEFDGGSLADSMAQVRRFAEHRKMGHDSGKEVK